MTELNQPRESATPTTPASASPTRSTPATSGGTGAAPLGRPAGSSTWRVVDIVTCAVIGIAFGVVFIGWNFTGATLDTALNAAIPGSSGILLGVWMLAGLVAAFVVRKPGAAIIAEVLAAVVEMVPGSQWGLGGLLSGIAQGLGVEIVVAAFLYRRWGLKTALLAGGVAALVEWFLELFMYNGDKTMAYNASYGVFCVISGIVITGALGWFIVRALAKTGALSQFAAGREGRGRVA